MSNPLNLPDQEPPPENPDGEPNMVDWQQPYSPVGEAPTSAPKNPPQPPPDNTPVEDKDEED